jgi:addiction module RelE/StbE family toxin
MTKLVISPSFARAVRKFTRRNKTLQQRIEQTLELLASNWKHPQLTTHKLSGELQGAWACSCGYDCRIVFSLEHDAQGEMVIVLADVGKHDEVY